MAAASAPMLGKAAAALERQVDAIVSDWLARVKVALFSDRPDLTEEDIRDVTPDIVRGVAEALHQGQPGEVTAPWTGAARRHALLRRVQGIPLGNLAREYQILRETIWAALRSYLGQIPSDAVSAVAANVNGVLDTMIIIVTSSYGEELQREVARQSLTASSIPDSLIICNEAGDAVRLNEIARQTLGLWEEPLPVARERLEAVHVRTANGERISLAAALLQPALRGETTRGLGLTIQHPRAALLWVTAGSAPIRDADGTLFGAVIFLTDVTALHEAQAATEYLFLGALRAREDAEPALHSRDEFLGVVAHELKTPITTLRGFAELTVRRMDTGRITGSQEIRRAFQTIERQADRLSVLTNQLFDLTRLETDELVLKRETVDLAALVRRVAGVVQSGAAHHTLDVHAPSSLEANVDPERLRQVLSSLIDNAIKYSPQDSRVEVDLSAPDAETVRIAVRDHGPGLPAEQRAPLFTRYFKAGTRRPAGGLGLGLYLAQRLVALHGGAIAAEFPEDGGSRFVITLPRQVSPKTVAYAQEP